MHVGKSDQCDTAEPWAVIDDATGDAMSCHLSQADAEAMMAEMMADGGMMGSHIKPERRYFTATDLRAKGGSSPGLIGHAAVFNELSDDLGGFREEIMPGAFSDSIKADDVRALWNHDPNFPLARTKSGTLRLSEDRTGLKIDADLPDTQFARDLMKSIERRDVDQMSFGFRVLPKDQKWEMRNGSLVRSLVRVGLFDVSPVTFPAYPQTDVGVRALAAEMRAKLNAEISGHSQEAAEKIKAVLEARRQERLETIERLAPQDLQYPLAEKAKAEFEARRQERLETLRRLTPPPDKYSLDEILKRCRTAT